MDRKSKLTSKLNLKGNGLELGPLAWPILTRREASIEYVDHATTAELRNLYKHDAGVPNEQIVDVDFALSGRPLTETVGSKKFDYVLASHVIEHVPDIIGWLQEINNILKPGGILSLAIPDKRYTFDIDRNVTRSADILAAHIDKNTSAATSAVYDHFRNYRSKVDPAQVWDGQLYLSEEAGPHRYSIKESYDFCIANKLGREYIDTHIFVFTPASFFEALRDLIELSMLPFKVAFFYDTAEGGIEFIVGLKKIPSKTSKSAILSSIPELHTVQMERQLQSRIDELSQEVDMSKLLLAASESRFSNVTGSFSWRITKPLRLLGRLLRTLSK